MTTVFLVYDDMAKLVMKLDSANVDKYLSLVKKNVGNTRPVMVFAVSVMSQAIVTRFRNAGQAPHKWPKLKPSTIRARIKEGTFPGGPLGQPILMRFGTLFQSFQVGRGKNNFTLITSKSAEFGTILLKAKTLQFGAPERSGTTKSGKVFRFGRIPPRPFVYWDQKSIRKVMSFMFAFAFQPGIAKKFGTPPKDVAFIQ